MSLGCIKIAGIAVSVGKILMCLGELGKLVESLSIETDCLLGIAQRPAGVAAIEQDIRR